MSNIIAISERTIRFQDYIEDILEELDVLIKLSSNLEEQKGLSIARGMVEYQYEILKQSMLDDINQQFGDER